MALEHRAALRHSRPVVLQAYSRIVSSISKRGSPSRLVHIRRVPAQQALVHQRKFPSKTSSEGAEPGIPPAQPPQQPPAWPRPGKRPGAGKGVVPRRVTDRGSNAMAACNVSWRAGRFARPAGEESERLCRRASSAGGEKSLTRTAASSIARGRPSSLRQISATAGALPLVSWKSGWTARARWTKKATASYWSQRGLPTAAGGSRALQRGHRELLLAYAGATQHGWSPALSGRGRAQQIVDEAAASTTCSKLSSTSSICRSRR